MYSYQGDRIDPGKAVEKNSNLLKLRFKIHENKTSVFI